MARLLSSVGTVSYNGFTFPAPFDAEVSIVPQMDSSNRYVKYVKYTITISSIIVPDDAPTSTAGDQVDENLEDIRCRLLKSGGSLRFLNQGLGTDLTVNAAGSSKIDVAFGPHPRMLSWVPTGSNRAARIVWSVEVTIPECCETSFGTSQLLNKALEHNFTISWDINEEGVTTRIVQGRLELPGFRTGVTTGAVSGASGRSSLVSADKLWDKVHKQFLFLPGFRREARRSLSQDRRTLEYVITDKEIPSDNPLFPYMIRMEVEHNTRLGMPNLFRCENTLSGTIAIAPKTPRHWAWLAFSKVAFHRFKLGATGSIKLFDESENPKNIPARAFLTEIVWNESLYAREFRFSLSWWFGIGALTDVFKGSGLFQPVSGSSGITSVQGTAISWAAWTASLTQTANAARGLALLSHKPSDDIMINICDDQPAIAVNGSTYKQLANKIQFPVPENVTRYSRSQSWMSYDMTLTPRKETNVVRHRVLKNVPTNSATPKSRDPNSPNYSIDDTINEDARQESVIEQNRGPSTNDFSLSGSAMRIGYPIPLPMVTGLGTKTPTVLSIVSSQQVVGQYFDKPIYAAVWKIDYSLSSTPTGDLMTSIRGDAAAARVG